jgi:hypothetical protein
MLALIQPTTAWSWTSSQKTKATRSDWRIEPTLTQRARLDLDRSFAWIGGYLPDANLVFPPCEFAKLRFFTKIVNL